MATPAYLWNSRTGDWVAPIVRLSPWRGCQRTPRKLAGLTPRVAGSRRRGLPRQVGRNESFARENTVTSGILPGPFGDMLRHTSLTILGTSSRVSATHRHSCDDSRADSAHLQPT